MSNIRFSGFPAGSATIGLRQAGQVASLTYPVPDEPMNGERNCYFLRNKPDAENWLGMSVTTDPGNGYRLGWGMSPPVFRRLVQVQKDAAHRIIDPGFRDVTWKTDLFMGATADVYRINNGEMYQVRQGTVIGGNWGLWEQRGAVSTPGFNHRFDNWNGRDAPYWFSVAAIDSGGLLGARAQIGYHMPGGANGAANPDNPNAANLSYVEGGSLPAPGGLTLTPAPGGPNGLNLTWDPVPGAAGYIVFIAYSDPANFVEDRYLELEDDGGAPLRAGDMVILTRRIMAPSTDFKSSRVTTDTTSHAPFFTSPIENIMNESGRGFTYAYHDWSVEEPKPDPALGTTFARISVEPGDRRLTVLNHFWAGWAGQSWYTVPQPDEMYRWRAWLRVDRAVEVRFTFGFMGAVNQTLFLQPGWQEIVLEGSPSGVRTESGQVGAWNVTVMDRSAPLTMDVAGVRLHELSTPFHHLPPNLAELVTPGMLLRDHSLIKPGPKTTDVMSLTNPPGESPRESTLESVLQHALASGGRPWLQIEWYHTVEDWLDLLAYVAAPVSSGHPMALKRHANGRFAPWTDAFDEIHWEFGNEAWNGLAEFWNPPVSMPDEATGESHNMAAVYGKICRRAALAMQGSPFWSDKIKWVLGGWARQAWSKDIARAFALPCDIGIANYNGGWDEGNVIVQENDLSYQNTMAVVPGATGDPIDTLVAQLKELTDEPGFPLKYGTDIRPTCYEAGPGYQMNGLNGAVVTREEQITQEVVMKSRAAATGTLDTMMYQAVRGFTLFNFFIMGVGDTWKARASDAQGGSVYPTFGLPKVVMEQMGEASVYGANPIRPETFGMFRSSGHFIETEAISIYGVRSKEDPGRFMLILINRSGTMSVRFSVMTVLRAADAANVWTNIGDYREHNRYPAGQRLTPAQTFEPDPNCVDIFFDPMQIDVPADLARIEIDSTLGVPGLDNGLPPGGALLIRFDGVKFEGE